MRSFVIVVDAQTDFMSATGALPVPGADEIIEPLQNWLTSLKPDEVEGVLFTFDTHVPERYAKSEEAARFPPHCMSGSEGWRLAVDWTRIDPAIECYSIEKGVFDMWIEDDAVVRNLRSAAPDERRGEFFGQLARKTTKIVVVGVAADFCVRWAVEGLIERGFQVTVPAGLTRGILRDIAAVAREEWRDKGAVQVTSALSA